MKEKKGRKQIIDFLFDQSDELEALLEEFNSGLNMQAGFSYPSAFGKTTVLQVIKSYFSGENMEEFQNWKIIKRRKDITTELKVAMYDTKTWEIHQVMVDILLQFGGVSQETKEMLTKIWKASNKELQG